MENKKTKNTNDTVEIIAQTIEELSQQVKLLLGGRLKRNTIIILLAHSAKLPQKTISEVLNAIERMDKEHLLK
jgi:predicted nucleic-acid-binding protein